MDIKDYAQKTFTPAQVAEQVRLRKNIIDRMLNQYIDSPSSENDDAATLRAKLQMVETFEHYAKELAQIMRLFLAQLGPKK